MAAKPGWSELLGLSGGTLPSSSIQTTKSMNKSTCPLEQVDTCQATPAASHGRRHELTGPKRHTLSAQRHSRIPAIALSPAVVFFGLAPWKKVPKHA